MNVYMPTALGRGAVRRAWVGGPNCDGPPPPLWDLGPLAGPGVGGMGLGKGGVCIYIYVYALMYSKTSLLFLILSNVRPHFVNQL